MIADWDDAYASAAHIAEADMFPRFWAARAAEHCAARLGKGRAQLDLAYGENERERLDLFRPDGRSKGLAVFVHGGDWSRFDKSSWSHLSDGSLRRGWTVAVPSYPLAPKARIKDIARAIARAVGFAARMVPGPITLAGHCSGGHLAARMGCLDGPLQEVERRRLARVIAISGVFDLRPLLKACLNEMLRSTRRKPSQKARRCCARSKGSHWRPGSAPTSGRNTCARAPSSPISGAASAPRPDA